MEFSIRRERVRCFAYVALQMGSKAIHGNEVLVVTVLAHPCVALMEDGAAAQSSQPVRDERDQTRLAIRLTIPTFRFAAVLSVALEEPRERLACPEL